MRSQLAELSGVQVPQIVHLPPDVASLDAAEEAIELADTYGVADGHPLDESQKYTLRAALGERADGSWAAATVGDFEPRQNGKNDTCAARELAGLILFGERLIIHTAHEFPTANESFLRLVAVFENWDDLRRKVARIRYANGEQGIELSTGQRLKYRARTGGSGRGFAKADLLVYDEAQHLQAEHVAASGPARLANPNNQSWYMGSGGLPTSSNAWRMRRRALSGDGGRFAYVEHTAEVVRLVGDQVVSVKPDVLDRQAWARANPAYGHRITDESMFSLYEELGPELYARECLCLWDPELGSDLSVIPPAAWEACRDPKSGPVGGVSFSVDVSPDREWASIAVAGESGNGGVHVEVIERHPGTLWLAARVAEVQAKWGGTVAISKGSPAWSLETDLVEAGVELTPVSTEEHSQACGALLDDITNSRLRHMGQPELDVAVKGAGQRNYGDTWLWSRRTSTTDISPLVAVTLARWAHTQAVTYDALDSVW
jgi:hypothetical protein